MAKRITNYEKKYNSLKSIILHPLMKTYDLRINNKIYTLDDAYALYEDVLNIDCFCDIECKSLNNIKDLDKLNRNDRARMSYYLDIKLERVVDKILSELDIKKEKLRLVEIVID